MPQIAGRNVEQPIVPEHEDLQGVHALEGVVLQADDVVVREIQFHQGGQITECGGMHRLDAIEAEIEEQQVGQALEGVLVQGADQIPAQVQGSQFRLVLEVLGAQRFDDVL